MRLWAFLLLWLSLAGCAQMAAPALPDDLFTDPTFGPPAERVAAAEVFALSDEMRRYIDTELPDALRGKGRRGALIDALYKRSGLKLEYDSTTTRNAAEAFAARSGNCLSLVLMTAAFAKALDLPVTYQSAFTDETWSRNGDLYFKSGHVNITLGRPLMERAGDSGARDASALMIDFLPASELRGLRTTSIAEATVIAMYMNNRAAEALARGRLDDAYAWAHEAVHQSPGFRAAQNTLGVIYLRHGERERADRVFAHILEHEPSNAEALANRAHVLTLLGRDAEAARLRERLAQVEPYPPFHFFDLGIAAMQRGDFAAARALFAREVDRAAYHGEFHFWLGLADFRLGRVDEARKHLGLALENSSSGSERELYAAKLEWLRSYRRQ